jgi:serine/threonine-protein kinase RsbW
MAAPGKKNLIELHIPSQLGYEKVAMDSAAAAARMMGFHESKIEDLKTAISEACTNAMEHGNRFDKETRVMVTLEMARTKLEVNIKDHGRGLLGKVDQPDLEKQMSDESENRGWGIFLIRNLVDEVEFKSVPDGGNVTRMVIHVTR